MDMATHPATTLMVAKLTKTCQRRWMLMLWDGQGEYLRTQLFRTRKEALQALQAHWRSLGVPCQPE